MFGKRFTIFKLLGFEVRIDASWLIIAILIIWTLAKGHFPFQAPGLSETAYWWMAIGGALGLFASIIVHEFAHSLVARRDGIPIKGITLFIFGGVAEMEAEPPTAGSEFRMAIAGPLTSVAIGTLFYATYLLGLQLDWSAAVVAVLSYLAFINIALAIFNLLPAFPLDGGRVLRGYLWSRSGNLRQSTKTVSKIGAIFGAGLIVMGLFSFLMGNLIGGLWWFLIGMFLRGASQMSYRQVEIRHALEGEPISRFMKEHPVVVPSSTTLQSFLDDFVYEHYYDMFPVVEGTRFTGCISTGELKRVPRQEWRVRTVGEIAEPCTEASAVSPNTDAIEALSLMSRTHKSRILVVDKGQVKGVVTLKDMLSFLALKLDLEEGAEESSELREAVAHR
jgi:Zn-dependent protease/CBS domain-containing protein